MSPAPPSGATSARTGELAGGALVVGIPEDRLDLPTARRLARLGPTGVIIFARNVTTTARLRGLVADIREVLDEPLLLVDQEGGRVDRLRALFGPSPSARALASRGNEAVKSEATAVASALRDLGFDVNCAPVVDLDEGLANGLGDRCLGSDPDEVFSLARDVVRAHETAGVLACLKHFPGLGRTVGDTHELRPQSPLSLNELGERELVPFRLLAAEAPAVMACHAAFPAVTGTAEPASLSRRLVGGLLRTTLGFDGLVLTDDLDMGAVVGLDPGARAVAAMAAGCDLLLFCARLEDAETAKGALVGAVAAGELDAARLEEAHRRVGVAKARVRGRAADGAAVRLAELRASATTPRRAAGESA